jgi:hypothetical protein
MADLTPSSTNHCEQPREVFAPEPALAAEGTFETHRRRDDLWNNSCLKNSSTYEVIKKKGGLPPPLCGVEPR